MMRVFVALLALALAPLAGAEEPPDVIVILADDLGWQDTGATGHPFHRTPHLDRFRAEGMRFTQAHSAAPICSASRAALLTGQTSARLHYEFVPKNKAGHQPGEHPLVTPPYPTELPPGVPTAASLLAAGGYHTAFFGKWHLNRHYERYLGWRPGHGPKSFGFETAVDDFGGHPYSYRGTDAAKIALPLGTYPDDTLTDRACDHVRNPGERPLFLWLAHYYVHDPFHSRCRALVEQYQSGLPEGASPDRAEFAAMVETLDHEVGRFLEALDRTERGRNALVVFTSDNGGHPHVSLNGPLRGSKWNLYQGGVRVPLFVRWRGHVAPGSTCDIPVHGVDLLPTLLEAAGQVPTTGIDGRSFLPALVGSYDPAAGDRPLVWHFPFYHPEKGFNGAKPTIGVNDFATQQVRPHSALRVGQHKLVYHYESDTVELFDLARDPAEAIDLSGSEPALAERLRAQLIDTLAAQSARLPEPRQ